MRLDAHCHTDCSDGNITIEDRIAMVKACKYDAATITDHDFISVEQVRRAKLACGELPFIPGIELSLSYNKKVVHLLGYFIDPSDVKLLNYLVLVGDKDLEITRKLLGYFSELGLSLSIQDLESTSLHTFYSLQLVKRLARDLYDNSNAKTLSAFLEAMDSLKLIYSDFAPWPVREAIDLIHHAGGIAVLAHPGGEKEKVMQRLGFLNHDRDIIATYCGWGLDGIEVYTPVHTRREIAKYLEIANQFNLLITAGSDCHGEDPYLGPALMGTLNEIPADLYECMVERHRLVSARYGHNG